MTKNIENVTASSVTKTKDDILNNSSDILFLMDATLTNPNGDPYENIPRRCRTEKGDIGEITGVCLGQTIRGYLKGVKINNQTLCVFVDREADVLSSGEAFKEFVTKEKDILKKENREQFIIEKFLQEYIDVRLFGTLVTIQEQAKKKLEELKLKFKQNSIQFTGPVQLGTVGQTVHPIVIQKVPITSAFRSKEASANQTDKDPEQGTRGEKWVVNYGLYQFTPVIDATLAQKTKMTNQNKDLFVEALWCGIKTRISGSKTNQLPLLYLEVVYNDGIKSRIGRLSDFVDYKYPKEPQKISDIKINVSALIEVLANHKSVIKEVRLIEDADRLCLGLAKRLKEKNINVTEGSILSGKFNNVTSDPSASKPAQQ